MNLSKSEVSESTTLLNDLSPPFFLVVSARFFPSVNFLHVRPTMAPSIPIAISGDVGKVDR